MWSLEDMLILLLSTRLPICHKTRSQLAATRGCFVPPIADIKWRERLHRFNHKQRDKIRTSVCTVPDGNKDMASMLMCQNLQIRVETEVVLFLFTPLVIVHGNLRFIQFSLALHQLILSYCSTAILLGIPSVFSHSWNKNTHTPIGLFTRQVYMQYNLNYSAFSLCLKGWFISYKTKYKQIGLQWNYKVSKHTWHANSTKLRWY